MASPPDLDISGKWPQEKKINQQVITSSKVRAAPRLGEDPGLEIQGVSYLSNAALLTA